MAKKIEEFTVAKGQKVTNIFGTFDKDENGAYIIIENGNKHLFEEYAKYFLGDSIEIHAIKEE